MKTINLRNKLNGEKFVCENVKEVQIIDGVEYLLVHRINETRNFLMRKDALEKDAQSNLKKTLAKNNN